MFETIPTIDLALAMAVAIAGLASLAAARRGGQYRGLAGWGGFWVLFGGLLIALSRSPRWVGYTLLGMTMFVSLRAFYTIAPLRVRDRNVILLSYLAVPFVLWLSWDSDATFLATVPIALFLVLPVFLSRSADEQGFFDSLGRTLFGVLLFVFCVAHLGLLINEPQPGIVELLGVLLLASELPQRLAGRFRPDSGWVRPTLGVLAGILIAAAAGYALAPSCGLVDDDGARAGILVAMATTLGSLVAGAIARDLSLTTSSSVFGRGAFLSRTMPIAYATPVFFHYLNHFA